MSPADDDALPRVQGRPVHLLSVIAPCRNERAHIEAFCHAVAAQRLPAGLALEVLVADGESEDGTREWLEAWCAARSGGDVRYVCIPNPGRIVSTGLNRCIAAARGEVIARLDIHSVYAEDYLAQCLAALVRSGADNVGGPWVAEPDPAGGAWAQAIAAAFQSRWVAGGARSRDTAFEGEVDTVYLGCWPRASFERWGGFDEALVRNQDDEHNLRLRLGGARIWQSAAIRSRYRPRATLAALARQWRQYGYWKPFVARKHGQAASWRHRAPGLFVAALGLTMAAAPLSPWIAGAALGLIGAYAAAVLGLSLVVAAESGRWALLPRLPVVIATYHLAYGLGSLRGGVDARWRGRPDAAFGRLTR